MRISGLLKVFIEFVCYLYELILMRIDSEDIGAKLETTDLLETVTGSPSEHEAAKEEEKMETQTLLIQQVKDFTEKKTNQI
jgi:hypothetical protein